MTRILVGLFFTAVSSLAAVTYQNTTTDQQFSIFYSTGYTEIGDQIQLTSETAVSSVDAQFFNDGGDATFDAELRFYDVGSPVGPEIGSAVTVTDIFIASDTSQTVSFQDLVNMILPSDVIVTLVVLNVSSGGDIGVNFFDPPTVGSSSNDFFIASDGTGLAQVSTNLGIDNLYFSIDGAAVPEPGTAVFALGGILLIAFRRCLRGQAKYS